jgi:hypothetical protein
MNKKKNLISDDGQVFMVFCLLLSSIILLVYDIPRGLHFFAYIIGGAGYSGQGSNFAWSVSVSHLGHIHSHTDETRHEQV